MAEKPVTLPDLARTTGASVHQLRHWSEALGHPPAREGRCRVVSYQVAGQLATVARMVADGTTPTVAIRQVIATTGPVEVIAAQPPAATGGHALEVAPPADLQRALLAVADGQRQGFEQLRGLVAGLVENQQQLAAVITGQAQALEESRQEVAALRAVVGSMAGAAVNQVREVAAIRAAIAKPAHVCNLANFTTPAPAAVRAWSPPPARPDPLAGMTWWRKALVKAFAPAKLRRREG